MTSKQNTTDPFTTNSPSHHKKIKVHKIRKTPDIEDVKESVGQGKKYYRKKSCLPIYHNLKWSNNPTSHFAIWRTQNLSIHGFWGSEILKGLVGIARFKRFYKRRHSKADMLGISFSLYSYFLQDVVAYCYYLFEPLRAVNGCGYGVLCHFIWRF